MHEGHRQRLWKKLEDGSNLYEHELLEMLLFNAVPRMDVNPLAHEILNRFPSIKEACSASVEELTSVKGVGKNVALYLKLVGTIFGQSNNCESFAVIKNTQEFIKFISMRFRNKGSEVLELYFLDKNGRVKRIITYTSNDTERVDVAPEELSKAISNSRPFGVFMAHNHVNYPAKPSIADDELTKQIQLICSINNARLYDHCIYSSDGEVFSYYLSDRLDKIKEEFSVNRIIKNGQ